MSMIHALKTNALIILATLTLLGLTLPKPVQAVDSAKKEHKTPAIVLVTFGTSVKQAQIAFDHIEKQMRAAFPEAELRWAYTSSMVRKKLAQEGTRIDSPEMALARLMDEGYSTVLLQSLHMIPGAEFHDLSINARLFSQMAGGIKKLRVSPPLLVTDEAMNKTLDIIASVIVPKERKQDEAVILMGHGTHHPSDAIYSALMYKAQKIDANIYVATVEGSPSLDEVKAMLAAKKTKKAYLIPLMTVAGDHAMNDMAGDAADSWKSQLLAAGVEAMPVMHGLGEFDAIVELWIEQLRHMMQHADEKPRP